MKKLLASLVLGALWLAAPVSFSPAKAEFGSKTTRIIFPFGAGGSGDAVARLLAEHIRSQTGQSVIVENRTGAAGRIGVQAVKSAEPDGTTLLLTPFSLMIIYPHIYSNLNYDPDKDFTPVSQISGFEFAMAVSAKTGVKSLSELVQWLKRNPSEGTYGSPGAGTIMHFYGDAFGRALGLDLRHLAYRGTAAAVNDATSGHIPIIFATTSDLLEHHRSGSVRILMTFDKARSVFVPEIATAKEQNIDLSGNGWFGLYAPSRTPVAIVEKINSIVRPFVRSDEFKERMKTLGLVAIGSTSQELVDVHKRESTTWLPIVKASGFKAID